MGIVRFFDASALMLPYVEGGTLVSVLQAMQMCSFSHKEQEIIAAMLGTRMTSAVDALHKLEIVHCDIKAG